MRASRWRRLGFESGTTASSFLLLFRYWMKLFKWWLILFYFVPVCGLAECVHVRVPNRSLFFVSISFLLSVIYLVVPFDKYCLVPYFIFCIFRFFWFVQFWKYRTISFHRWVWIRRDNKRSTVSISIQIYSKHLFNSAFSSRLLSLTLFAGGRSMTPLLGLPPCICLAFVLRYRPAAQYMVSVSYTGVFHIIMEIIFKGAKPITWTGKVQNKRIKGENTDEKCN